MHVSVDDSLQIACISNSHYFSTISQVKDIVEVSECEDSSEENEQENSDIFYHLNYHPDEASSRSEESQEVEQLQPEQEASEASYNEHRLSHMDFKDNDYGEGNNQSGRSEV